MAFIPVADCVELVLQFIWAGQQVNSVFNFIRAGGIFISDMEALGTAVLNWWDTEMAPLLSNNLALTGAKVTDLSSATDPVVELPLVTPNPGDISAASVPNNVALVTSFLTLSRGRSYRGRVYTPGLSTGSILTPTTVAAAQAMALSVAYAELGATATTEGFTHAVVSRYTGGAPRAAGVATPVDSYRTEQYLDSQRRRLAGRGE